MARGDNKTRPAYGHIPALDGVRGLAILAVFLVHYGGGQSSHNPILKTVGDLVQLGWAGVTLFFVLSGFLITGILWRSLGRRHWWRNFAIRRALRIFPLYYLTLALIAIVALWRGTLAEGLHPLLVFAFYAQNWNFDGHIPRVAPMEIWHYWSLAVEEQFYLVWPFLLAAARSLRQARWGCVVTVIASVGFRVWMENTGRFAALWQSTPAHAGELAVGAWLALTLIEQPGWLDRARRFAGPVLLLVVAITLVAGGSAHNFRLENPAIYVWGVFALSIAGAALLVLALAGGRVARLLAAGPLRRLGTISYGLYVYQVFLLFLFTRITDRLVPWTHGSRNTYNLVRLLVAAVISVIAAEISFRFFEQPLLRLKDRLAPSPAVAIPVAAISDEPGATILASVD